MKTTTVLLILGGVAILGLGFVVVKNSTKRTNVVPPTPQGFGPANTPQQQFAVLTGTLASQLATTGINKLGKLFN